MDSGNKNPRIKITENGPYIVTGNVPLTEQVITPNGAGYTLEPGRTLPQAETYALCRCGRSTNPPFCDGSHITCGFEGQETAGRAPYEDRAEVMEGPGVDLMDDGRCAFARFCHRENGNAWELTEESYTKENRTEAITAANECLAGRLTARDKDGHIIEPVLSPSVIIVQDPERGASAGIAVTGNIPIEAVDGTVYEVRNRVALCRCGGSRNKPFCDAEHITIKFEDHEEAILDATNDTGDEYTVGAKR